MLFVDAMQTADVRGENNMPTHSTSGSYLLDWFFHMGAMRQNSAFEILHKFKRAFVEDPQNAFKSAFVCRDVRGGMGERRTFRIVLHWLALHCPDAVIANLHNIPYFGRWDDVLFATLKTEVEPHAIEFIQDALSNGDALCAKWMPREGKRYTQIARYLATKMGLSPREYRQLVADNTRVVETLMCEGRWGEIEFSKVPSQAFRKYRKAFERHEPQRFAEFLDQVEAGAEQVHAGAIFPHEIIRKALGYDVSLTEKRAVQAQWDALPEYDVPAGTLVVADVSGSMEGEPMQVSVSLALYFAERLEGAFRNVVCAFSRTPEFVKVPDADIVSRASVVRNMDWGMNTDLEAVFRHLLVQAQRHELQPEQMPGTILIISDMQFDECVAEPHHTAMDMLRKMYATAGYQVPQVIFWNVRSSTGVPAKVTETGAGLLSGFSPSLIKSVMQGEVTPLRMMEKTLNDPRYDRVVVE